MSMLLKVSQHTLKSINKNPIQYNPMESSDHLVRPGLTCSNKKLLPDIKRRLRAKVKPLNENDVRRSKLAYHDALILELTESNNPSTAALLQQFIDVEKGMNFLGDIHYRQLKDSEEVIDEIVDFFQGIEGKMDENGLKQMFEFTIHFCDKFSSYKWLVEQIFLIGISEAIKYKSALYEARMRFLYGNFLRDKIELYFEAQAEYEKARHLITGHEKDWTMSETNCFLLIREVNRKYFSCLIKSAEQTMEDDEELSMKNAEMAIEVARSVDDLMGLTESYLMYGRILMFHKNYTEALDNFKITLEYAHKAASPLYTCEAYYQLAAVCQEDSDFVMSERYLKTLQNASEKYNMLEYMPRYLEFQGRIFLEKGYGMLAAEQFFDAINIYDQMQWPLKLQQVRLLAAHAMEKEIHIPFSDAMLKVDGGQYGNNYYLQKLLNWIFLRTPFWNYIDIAEVSESEMNFAAFKRLRTASIVEETEVTVLYQLNGKDEVEDTTQLTTNIYEIGNQYTMAKNSINIDELERILNEDFNHD